MAPMGGSCGQTRYYCKPPPAITNTDHYQPTHLSNHLPLPPPTMMTGDSGGCQWLVVVGCRGLWQLMAPVGGSCGWCW